MLCSPKICMQKSFLEYQVPNWNRCQASKAIQTQCNNEENVHDAISMYGDTEKMSYKFNGRVAQKVMSLKAGETLGKRNRRPEGPERAVFVLTSSLPSATAENTRTILGEQ